MRIIGNWWHLNKTKNDCVFFFNPGDKNVGRGGVNFRILLDAVADLRYNHVDHPGSE